MTKQKQVFRKCCKCIKNKKQKYLIYISIRLCYKTRNWVQVHPVSIHHPPVVNSIDYTWFGKAHTCLFKVPQLTVHVRVSPEVEGIVHRAPRQDCVETQILGRVPKMSAALKVPKNTMPSSKTLPIAGRMFIPWKNQPFPATIVIYNIKNVYTVFLVNLI